MREILVTGLILCSGAGRFPWVAEYRLSHEKKKKKSFAELADWYVEHPKVQARKSYSDIRRIALKLKNYFGQYFLDDTTPSMVEKYQVTKLKEVKPATVNRYLATLKRIFNLAIRARYVEKNPVWKVEMFKEKPRNRAISYEEFKTLLSHLPEHTADIVTVAYYTGMRRGEILSLKWNQVDLAKRLVYLGKTKNNEPRTAYLNDEVMKVFRRRLFKHTTYVFTHNGKPISNLRRSFNRACQLAGIVDFRFHDLRKCCRTNLRKAGVEPSVSMRILGHKTLQVHEIYNAVDMDDIVDAYAKLDESLAIVRQGKKGA